MALFATPGEKDSKEGWNNRERKRVERSMKLTRLVSILMLSVAFAASLVSSVAYTEREAAKRNAYYKAQEEKGKIAFAGPYCTPDKHPDRLLYITLLIGLAFGAALFPRLAAASFLFCLAAQSLFLYWYVETQRTISNVEIADFVHGLDRYLYKATEFDVGVLTLLILVSAIQTALFLSAMVTRRFSGKLP